jgi:UDP-N-acetylglucosamine transferase subunit ALG13
LILVTVGTNEARFDRLLSAVVDLRIEEPFLVQHGHSSPIGPANATLVDFLPFEDMVDAIREARAVITHAGVGSVMVALANGKRPIVVPRRRAFHEAVDDHQFQLGRRFAAEDLVTFVESPSSLGEVILERSKTRRGEPSSNALAAELRQLLTSMISARPPTAAREG